MDEHNDGLLLFSKKMAARFLEISGVEIQKVAEKAVRCGWMFGNCGQKTKASIRKSVSES